MKGSWCVGRAEREGEMVQGDVVVAVTGQAGQDHADLVGDFNLYLKSKENPSVGLNREATFD